MILTTSPLVFDFFGSIVSVSNLFDRASVANALVSTTVNSAKGRELVLTYEGGSQKVMVADSAAITSLTPGQRSHSPSA